MAWGRSEAQPASATSHLIPLFITFLFLSGVAWVLYQVYVSVGQIRAQANKQMGSHNVVFTKDGVRVGVQHVENERYVDATQSWVVKAWNMRGGGGGDKAAAKKKK